MARMTFFRSTDAHSILFWWTFLDDPHPLELHSDCFKSVPSQANHAALEESSLFLALLGEVSVLRLQTRHATPGHVPLHPPTLDNCWEIKTICFPPQTWSFLLVQHSLEDGRVLHVEQVDIERHLLHLLQIFLCLSCSELWHEVVRPLLWWNSFLRLQTSVVIVLEHLHVHLEGSLGRDGLVLDSSQLLFLRVFEEVAGAVGAHWEWTAEPALVTKVFITSKHEFITTIGSFPQPYLSHLMQHLNTPLCFFLQSLANSLFSNFLQSFSHFDASYALIWWHLS